MVSSQSKDEIVQISKSEIDLILTKSKSDAIGAILLSFDESEIKIGAMNPVYSEVKKISQLLKDKFKINVDISPISSEEFEKWVSEDSQTISNVYEDNKIIEKNQISLENKPLNLSETNKDIDNDKLILDKNNSPLEKKEEKDHHPKTILNELIEKSKLESEGITSNEVFEFDFFEEEEEDEEEEDSEIIEDSELLATNDPVVSAVGSILSTCGKLKASDIHVEPMEDKMRIRYRIDGVLKEIYSLPKAKAKAISSRLKVMSKLDIAEKRLPQDGRIRCSINKEISDFRVSTLPGKWGEKIVLRSLQSDTSMLKLEKLITYPSELKQVRDMGSSPYGIFIVVGPTGSGKSTTLFSILNERNTSDVNISTVEDPVEYTLNGVHQVQVIREKGLDFSRALRSLMRQDPDIILVGETRDKETAQTAMEAALTGHMVFTTLHANDTATAITRLAEMGCPPYLVGSSVIGVMAQRLIRKVCSNCCETVKADPTKHASYINYGIKEFQVANVIDLKDNDGNDQTICKICNGTGYKGRLGIYEVMKVNDPIRELIMKSSTADIIREYAYKNGVKSLLMYGMDLVKDKLTTIDEVERVCLLEDETDEK